MIILRDNGVVNSFLQAVGLTSEPIILLNTDFSVILGMTYGFLPFAILPIFVVDRPPRHTTSSLRRATCTRPGRSAFLHVTLPLSMPGVIAAAILTFIPAMGDFVTPDLLGGAQQTTIAKVIQERFLDGRDWPFGSALGFVLIAVTLVGTVIALRNVRGARSAAANEPRAEPAADRCSRSLVYVFLFAPIVVLIVFSFNDSRRTFVWRGFTTEWYGRLLSNDDLLAAVGVTLQVALVAVVVSTVLGTLLGLGLARLQFRGHGSTETLAAPADGHARDRAGPVAAAVLRRPVRHAAARSPS